MCVNIKWLFSRGNTILMVRDFIQYFNNIGLQKRGININLNKSFKTLWSQISSDVIFTTNGRKLQQPKFHSKLVDTSRSEALCF